MSAHKVDSGTQFNVLDALKANFMLMVVVIAQMEPSLMELNVLFKLLINVFLFQILTGMEPTVFVSQVSQLLETHAIVMVLLWVTIAKDVLQNQIQSGPMEFVNATMVMLT